MADVEGDKAAAARAAAQLVEHGMTVGLGTGSTVRHLIPALAARQLRRLRCVATSRATERSAREAGLEVEPFDELDRLDIAIDGADQVDPECWLLKGGGGAHTREKIVAAAADRFVVIVGADKLVDALHAPVPVEALPYGLPATLCALESASVRDAARTPDGGVILDFFGPIGDRERLAARLSATPGVVEHGIFAPGLVSEILIAEEGVLRRQVPARVTPAPAALRTGA